MHTIVLASQKGGCGKSTLSIGLAMAAKDAGHNVRLIETDPQGTLSNWHKRRIYAEPMVETIHGAQEIAPRLHALEGSGVTLAIIDTAGGISAARTVAIRHADLCLIPARPSIADIEATASTLSLVRTWRKSFAFVLNQAPMRGQRIGRATDALTADALEFANVLARPFIVMRNDHQDALNAGLAIGEYAPGSKAAEEIRSLWRWIEARLADDARTSDRIAGERAAPPHAAVLLPTQGQSAAFVP